MKSVEHSTCYLILHSKILKLMKLILRYLDVDWIELAESSISRKYDIVYAGEQHKYQFCFNFLVFSHPLTLHSIIKLTLKKKKKKWNLGMFASKV